MKKFNITLQVYFFDAAAIESCLAIFIFRNAFTSVSGKYGTIA